ncbi:MAG TPA: hypothetical protein PKH95_02380 [Candidatus Magasanikbacteria bacterium]|nr:hypothetical protein [Candidatus Magasanikbacteria bacterium]
MPLPLFDIIINVLAGLGAILVTYAVFLEHETRQDIVLAIGSFCLLVYALWIGNAIFSLAMGGLFLASMVEFVEILVGIHIPVGVKTQNSNVKSQN